MATNLSESQRVGVALALLCTSKDKEKKKKIIDKTMVKRKRKTELFKYFT